MSCFQKKQTQWDYQAYYQYFAAILPSIFAENRWTLGLPIFESRLPIDFRVSSFALFRGGGAGEVGRSDEKTKANPTKPNGVNSFGVKKMNCFQKKQTHSCYLASYQSVAAILPSIFDKNGWTAPSVSESEGFRAGGWMIAPAAMDRPVLSEVEGLPIGQRRGLRTEN